MAASKLAVRARLSAAVSGVLERLHARSRGGAIFPLPSRFEAECLERRLMLTSVLTATATPSGPITLNWAINFVQPSQSQPQTSVLIERSTDGTTFQPLTTVNPVDWTYQDSSVSAAHTYFYRIDTPPSGGSSQSSNIATATSAPTGNKWVLEDTVAIPVDGTSVTSNIQLAAGVTYQLRASGDFYLGGATGRADAEYSYSATTGFSSAYDYNFQYGIGINDTTLGANKYPYWGSYNPSHQYQADVVGDGSTLTLDYHDDNYSDNVADDTQNPLQVEIWAHLPAAPRNLTATPDSNTDVLLNWQNNATDQTGFGIERSDDGGATYSALASVDAATTSYLDTGRPTGQTYYYRVYAFNDKGNSDYSNIASTAAASAEIISGHVYQTTIGGQQVGPLAGIDVYVDVNGNNARDPGEPYATSAADGSYTLVAPVNTNTNPTYALQPDLSSGPPAETTTPAALSYQVSLNTGGTITGQDFGVYLNQAPTFDSNPPNTVHVNPFAPTVPLTSTAWKQGELFLGQTSSNVSPAGIERVNPDGTPVDDAAPNGAGGAEFLKYDTNTGGNWGGVYGSDGYALFGTTDTALPDFAQLNAINATSALYPGHDADSAAMQISSASTAHLAAGYLATDSFTLDLNLTDHKAHQVSLYMADYNHTAVKETIQVSDMSGTVLDTRSLPTEALGIGIGEYITWNLSGHVQIAISGATPAGTNPLATGLLFDPVKTRLLTATNLDDPTGMAFDPAGRLFGTSFLSASEYEVPQFNVNGLFDHFVDPNGFPDFSGTESIVFDGLGNMYVGNVGLSPGFDAPAKTGGYGIYKFSPTGDALGRFAAPQEVDWMDLAADQHTMVFDSEGNTIYRVDTNSGQLETPFAVIPDPPQGSNANYAYAMRYIPNGGTTVVGDDGQSHTAVLLLADSSHILALDGQGRIVKTYDATGSGSGNAIDGWFALNLDPDGTSFWSADGGDGDIGASTVVRFDIQTGRVITQFSTQSVVPGLAVFGERTAAIAPETSPLSYLAHAVNPNGHALIYQLLDPSNGAVIDSATGLLSWTPPGPGNYSFTVVAIDSVFPQLKATQTFSISVDDTAPAEQNPVFQTPSTLSPAMPGFQYVAQISAKDPSGDRITYSLVNSPGFTINSDTGTVGWTPTVQAEADGQGAFTAKAMDPRGGAAVRTFVVPVGIQTGKNNQVPVFDSNITIPMATVGQPLTFDFGASDPDGQAISFSATAVPAGMTLSSRGFNRGTLTWTPQYNQAGLATAVIVASDGVGGIVKKSFTFVVQPAPLSIDHIQVDLVDASRLRLTVVPPDPTMLKGATFTWSVQNNSFPLPQEEAYNPLVGDTHSPVFLFHGAGTYLFTVVGTDSHGFTTRYQQLVTVDQVPARLLPAPAALAVTASQAATFSASVFDQFGNPMLSVPPLTWSIASNASGGSINSSTGAYQAGSVTGTDIVRVSAPAGSGTVTADVNVPVSSGNAIAGSAATDMQVTEGQNISYSGSQGSYGFLGTIFDPQSGTIASNYTATVDFGDGSGLTAATVSPCLDPSVPLALRSHLFTVSAGHSFAQEGNYRFTIQVTGPSGRQATISPPPGRGIAVASAPVYAQPLSIRAMASRWFAGAVAEFLDTSPSTSASEFNATILWGDGTSSQGTIQAGLNGVYQVSGSHRYGSPGTPIGAVADIYEVDDGPPVLRASTALAVTVVPTTLFTRVMTKSCGW